MTAPNCGCHAAVGELRRNDESSDIEFCGLHAAAEQAVKALEESTNALLGITDALGPAVPITAALIEKNQAVLAAIRGGAP